MLAEVVHFEVDVRFFQALSSSLSALWSAVAACVVFELDFWYGGGKESVASAIANDVFLAGISCDMAIGIDFSVATAFVVVIASGSAAF